MCEDQLNHNELIAKSMLEILEERYDELSKEEKDGIIMLLLQDAITEN